MKQKSDVYGYADISNSKQSTNYSNRYADSNGKMALAQRKCEMPVATLPSTMNYTGYRMLSIQQSAPMISEKLVKY